MQRFDKLLIFCLFVLSSTVLFQNCSQMSANTQSSDQQNTNQDNDNDNGNFDFQLPEPKPLPLPEPNPEPEVISNRTINLDNPVTKDLNEGVSISFSFGGDDIFYFETDYKAQTKSTLVKIHSIDSKPFLTVDADGCQKMKELDNSSLTALTQIFLAPASLALTFNNVTPTQQGCAFPRLTIDTDDSFDFDFFVSPETCTPLDAHIYQSPDPVFVQSTNEFFQDHIDDLCE